MKVINEEDFDEIVALVIKELPKNNSIYERVYDGVIAYHCAKKLLPLNYDDLNAIKAEAKNRLESRHIDEMPKMQ